MNDRWGIKWTSYCKSLWIKVSSGYLMAFTFIFDCLDQDGTRLSKVGHGNQQLFQIDMVTCCHIIVVMNGLGKCFFQIFLPALREVWLQRPLVCLNNLHLKCPSISCRTLAVTHSSKSEYSGILVIWCLRHRGLYELACCKLCIF